MSPDSEGLGAAVVAGVGLNSESESEGLGAAVVAGVGSNLTHLSGISYLSLYIFSEELESVMILGRNSLLKFV